MDRLAVTGRELGLGLENKADESGIQHSHQAGRCHLKPSCRIFSEPEEGTAAPLHDGPGVGLDDL